MQRQHIQRRLTHTIRAALGRTHRTRQTRQPRRNIHYGRAARQILPQRLYNLRRPHNVRLHVLLHALRIQRERRVRLRRINPRDIKHVVEVRPSLGQDLCDAEFEARQAVERRDVAFNDVDAGVGFCECAEGGHGGGF